MTHDGRVCDSLVLRDIWASSPVLAHSRGSVLVVDSIRFLKPSVMPQSTVRTSSALHLRNQLSSFYQIQTQRPRSRAQDVGAHGGRVSVKELTLRLCWGPSPEQHCSLHRTPRACCSENKVLSIEAQRPHISQRGMASASHSPLCKGKVLKYLRKEVL